MNKKLYKCKKKNIIEKDIVSKYNLELINISEFCFKLILIVHKDLQRYCIIYSELFLKNKAFLMERLETAIRANFPSKKKSYVLYPRRLKANIFKANIRNIAFKWDKSIPGTKIFLSGFNFKNIIPKSTPQNVLACKIFLKTENIEWISFTQISLLYQKYFIISLIFLYSLTNSKCTQNGGRGQFLSLMNHTLTS